MQDSGKALQEKFALTREVNRLRPELEHLQSQLTNHQAVVAEKHALRRQVDTLEVELENERRARQRTKPKNDDGELDELRSHLQEAEKKLAAAKKEKEKMRRDHEKALAHATGRTEQLEGDQTAAITKLKQTQAELKEVRTQLKNVQQELDESRTELEEVRTSASAPEPSHSTTVPTKAEGPAKATGAKAKKSAKAAVDANRKRRMEELSLDDVSIGTPGNDSMSRPPKRRGMEQASVVEKSTFSITPFLNRNKGLDDVVLEDTPVVSKAPANDAPPKTANEPEARVKPSPKKAPTAKAPKARGRSAKAAAATLTETTSSKNNVVANEPAAQESSAPEQEQENVPSPKKLAPQASKVKTTAKSDTSSSINLSQADSKAADGEKKRKRKLLGAGKTLFDEDDDEPIRPVVGSAVRRIKAPLGGSNGFGAFSPLKRHKRGIGASFLA